MRLRPPALVPLAALALVLLGGCSSRTATFPGPVVLDASRHLLAARAAGDRDSYVVLDWLPGLDRAEFERGLLEARGNATLAGLLRPLLPDRLVTTLLSAVGLEDATRARGLTRKQRTDLVRILFEHRVEVDGDRGYTFAEATAGGVPLSEVRLDSMESRIVPGFHLVGEVLDVDGRVGGFNFQWAWATGHVAGVAIAGTLARA